MSILVIVAHPDDEILGAGGTIARHAGQGEKVEIVYLTDGTGGRGLDESAIARRKQSAMCSAAIVGAQKPIHLHYPDNRLDSVDLLDIVKALERILSETNPDTIYTHHAGDLNIDHVICQRAVMTACRPMPGTSVRRIYAMEIASSTEWSNSRANDAFLPTRFVDIADTLVQKNLALEAYKEEMRAFPHPRSYQAVTALATWRGASVGLAAAEAFMVLREIEG